MSDSETIARRRAEFAAAFSRADIPALSRLLTNDNVAMPPNRPTLRGIDESQALWREGFAAVESRFSVIPERLEIAGDVAIDRFRWSMDSAPRAGGPAVHDKGKNIWIWRRQPDGDWKLAQAIWNSDLPQAGSWSGAGTSTSRSTLSASDRETLRRLIENEWTAACMARDWDRTLAMCAEDIVYMPADTPALRGHAELRSWLDAFPRILRFAQPLEELEGDASLATARATFSGAVDAGGREVVFAGKVLCSLRKEPSGNWLVRRVCWNWDRPMPAIS